MQHLMEDRRHKVDLHLKGKNVLVVGASVGVGLEAAVMFAAEGTNVMLASRSEERLTRAVARVCKESGNKNVYFVVGDIRDKDSHSRFVEAAVAKLGTIDILVNNAGAALAKPNADMTDELWTEALNYKLLGYIRTTMAAFPVMRKNGGGVIINVIGGTGREPYSWTSSTGVVNAALLNFTKTTATQYAASGIRVNAVNPRQIDTKRLSDFRAIEPDGYAQTIAEIPMGRVGHPEEVASVIVFLASDRASFVTGTAIDVDGGATRSVSF